MKTFRSAASQGQAETIIKKSRFITRVFPVDTEEQAEDILKEIRELHKDATHNVYAWQVGVNKTVQRCSDDGEPGGTAGRPVLEVIKQNDLVNVLVIVTRYFGGIKLGAGGLIRAYSLAAREGIVSAGIVEKALHGKYKVTVDYSFFGQVQSVLEKCSTIEDVTYGEQVCFSIFVSEENQENLKRLLMDITGGQVVVEFLGNEFHQI